MGSVSNGTELTTVLRRHFMRHFTEETEALFTEETEALFAEETEALCTEETETLH